MENQDTQSIREQIEVTRERIADTAEALAYKSDVPARFKEDVAERLDVAKTTAAETAASISSVAADAADAAKSAAQDAAAAAKPVFADALETTARVAASLQDEAAAGIEAAKPAVANAAATVAAATSAARDNVADFADRTRATLAEANANARTGSRATPLDRAREFIGAHPRTVTLTTIAIGIFAGIVLPGAKRDPRDDDASP